MGSGKSSMGKKLAARMGFTFLDLDAKIEEEQKQLIGEIFSERGEKVFRAIEREALQQTSELNQIVVSTGGGTPIYFDNMHWMKAHGLCVYLQANPDVLSNRLKHNQQLRPLIATLNEEELLQFITNQLNERASVYEEAHLHIESKDLTPAILENQISWWLENQKEV